MDWIADKINELIRIYESVVKVVDDDARNEENEGDRAYGGIVRSVKGKLQEFLTEEIIKIAWQKAGGDINKIDINSKKQKIPIQKDYVRRIKDKEIRNYILSNIKEYFYGISVDKQVFHNDKLIVGIECKAYTENAMIKRILVDFSLLKTIYPDLECYLFQLESQLGGDYSELNTVTYGSKSTHTLMSYFSNIELHILTFIKGERRVDKPIHKFFKPIERKQIEKAIKLLEETFKKYT